MTCPNVLIPVSPANHAFSIDFLQDNNTLEALNLYENKIGDTGAAALAKALEVVCTCVLANFAFKIHAWRHGCCIFPDFSRNSAAFVTNDTTPLIHVVCKSFMFTLHVF